MGGAVLAHGVLRPTMQHRTVPWLRRPGRTANPAAITTGDIVVGATRTRRYATPGMKGDAHSLTAAIGMLVLNAQESTRR